MALTSGPLFLQQFDDDKDDGKKYDEGHNEANAEGEVCGRNATSDTATTCNGSAAISTPAYASNTNTVAHATDL